MRFLSFFIILAPISLFSQETDLLPNGCWEEYEHKNLPYPETEYCPLILCSDSATICYLKEENEMYTEKNGWSKISENQIEIGDGWKFNILKETDTELHLQSIEYSNFKIYLRR
jgi:hypothetical protein